MRFNLLTGENCGALFGDFSNVGTPYLAGISRSDMDRACRDMQAAIALDDLQKMKDTFNHYYGSSYWRSSNRATFWDNINALRNAIAGKEKSLAEQAAAKAEADAAIEAAKKETQQLVKQIIQPKTPKVAAQKTTGFNPMLVVVPVVGLLAFKFFKGK